MVQEDHPRRFESRRETSPLDANEPRSGWLRGSWHYLIALCVGRPTPTDPGGYEVALEVAFCAAAKCSSNASSDMCLKRIMALA